MYGLICPHTTILPAIGGHKIVSYGRIRLCRAQVLRILIAVTATVDYASIGVRKRAVGSLDAVTATVDPAANYGFIVDLGHSNRNI